MDNAWKIWIERAESALLLAKTDKSDDLFYEDLCFQLQQAAEKAIKAYLIFNNIEPRKTHSFKTLLLQASQIERNLEKLVNAITLEDYAVQTRYPGDYTPVSKEEYLEALEIACAIVEWVKNRINSVDLLL